MATIRIKRINYDTSEYLDYDKSPYYPPEVDGVVEYEVTYEVPCHGEWTSCLWQPFSKTGTHDVPGKYLIWEWDGNTVEPSLRPSFLCDCSPAYKVHLFLNKGRIDLCPDSTVVLSKSNILFYP